MALTYKNLQDQVLSVFDDTSAESLSDAKLFLNMAQRQVCNEYDWPFMQETSTITTAASTTEYTLATNFDKMHSVTRDNAYIQEVSASLFDQAVPNPTASGNPSYYTLFGFQKIQFYPIPSSVDTINYKYYKTPTEMSADSDTSDIPDKYREILVHYALSRMFLKDDEQRYIIEKTNFDNMIIQMLNDNHAGVGVERVGSEDDIGANVFNTRLDPDHFNNA